MFHMTPNLLKILISLHSVDGWPAFLKELKKIRDDNIAQNIHFNPDPDDANAGERHAVFRGVAICLDVLYNAFTDPVALLEEIKLSEKTEEKKNPENAF